MTVGTQVRCRLLVCQFFRHSFVTAYGALIEDAKVTKGDLVLTPEASSSVGLAAIQIANYAGATTIALTRTSAKKHQLPRRRRSTVIATEEVDTAIEGLARIEDDIRSLGGVQCRDWPPARR